MAAAVVLLGVVGLGYGYGTWWLQTALEQRVPACADSRTRNFEMTIVGEPVWDHGGAAVQPAVDSVARFIGLVTVPADTACGGLGRHRIRLAWYGAPVLKAGQRWRVTGKLRPPWGYRNPGGFDYERWLLGEGLHGTGYIRAGALLQDAAAAESPIGSLRRHLKKRIESQGFRHAPLLLALLLGDDAGISSEQWRWLRNSGTIHLLVVSGLHVGLIAGFVYFTGRWIVRCCPPLLLRFGAVRFASALAVVGSGCYVLLSGMGVPGSRAWLMSAAVLLAKSCGRIVSPFRGLGLVFALLLVANPLVIHQQGFWLSFAAVFALIGFFAPRVEPSTDVTLPPPRRLLPALWKFLLAQLVLLVALSPLLAAQGAIPLHSPVANFFAVPVVTFWVLPLTLLGGLCLSWLPDAGHLLLLGADAGLDLVMRGVRVAAEVALVPVSVVGTWEWVLILSALILLAAAPFRSTLVVAAALWLTVLLPGEARPDHGAFRVTALDVGQGSAILVETRHHSLLYDTGPAYPSGFNLGAEVVVPSLLSSGHASLDALILSHDDVDHTGGAGAVVTELRPQQLWSSFPFAAAGGGQRAERCGVDAAPWLWDGVAFRFLHPGEPPGQRDNDRSCVLLIEAVHPSAAYASALLAGDISASVERRLVKAPVDLLFAPHHGSRTSSSASFVKGFQPALVFISTTRRSRYGHPHPEVLARYRRITEQIFVTGWHGALRWNSSEPRKVRRLRQDEGAYWHGRAGR